MLPQPLDQVRHAGSFLQEGDHNAPLSACAAEGRHERRVGRDPLMFPHLTGSRKFKLGQAAFAGLPSKALAWLRTRRFGQLSAY